MVRKMEIQLEKSQYFDEKMEFIVKLNARKYKNDERRVAVLYLFSKL